MSGSMKYPGVGTGMMIVKENRVLLGLRIKDDVWSMPGGKVDLGENPKEGAIRETFEECGLKVTKAKLISVSNDINLPKHFFTLGFLAEEFDGEVVQDLEPDTFSKWQWFNMDELPENLFLPSIHILENYNAGEIYSE